MIPLANHLWQSTIVACAAGLITLALRNNRASVRYWVWLAASIKFLIPFSVLMTIGNQVEWRTTPVAVPAAVPIVLEQIGQPFSPGEAPTVSVAQRANVLPIVVFSIWGCGFLGVASAWARKYWKVRHVVRAAVRRDTIGPLKIPVVSSTEMMEPGIFGIFRPVLLLPEDILTRLTPAQLEAVVAHELCHVRRRDNLTAAIHMWVETIFWFHPLVWWIGTRLIAERERACDEEVLLSGSERRVYAESILKVCELYLESPVRCVSGVTGADLKRRIEEIMSTRIGLRLNFARKVILGAATVAALALPIAVGIINAPAARAQSKAVEFEVASVRPGDPSAGDNSGFKMVTKGNGGGTGLKLEHRRLTIRNFNLYALIVHAYGLKGCRPFGMEGGCVLLSGGPDWLQKGGFDIVAKMPDDSPDYVVAGSPPFLNGAAQQVHAALQALLEDRFHLKVHRETKMIPVFAFTVAKKGPKLRKTADGTAEPKIFFRGGVGSNGERTIHLSATNSSMQELAELYTKFMDRPVVDRTGLKDRFDFDVDYAANTLEPGPFTELRGPELFRAFEEQAGLKLEATKAPVEILVIDHAEKPSGN